MLFVDSFNKYVMYLLYIYIYKTVATISFSLEEQKHSCFLDNIHKTFYNHFLIHEAVLLGTIIKSQGIELVTLLLMVSATEIRWKEHNNSNEVN